MLTLQKITSDSKDFSTVMALYQEAFPENERRPLAPFLDGSEEGGEVVAFYDGERFCGFFCLLTYWDITHILYFAVEASLRGRGYGTEALGLVAKYKEGNRILADLEALVPKAENLLQRQKRKDFYLRNGYVRSLVSYDWQGESYDIFVFNGNITPKEFSDFWRHHATRNSR